MRRFLSTSFIALALLMGVVSATPTAQAYEETCPERSGQTWLIESDGLCHYFDSNRDEVGSPVDPTVIYDNTTAPLDTAAAGTPTTMNTGPTIDGPLAKVMNWIMSLFAWLLGVAAITLDNAVYYTVLTMGSYVNNLAAVGVTWTILRDIGNILLIFGFLAAGITTILNVDWYGGGKKMLPMLLVAAVFLNFSLFITEAIIDTGNLFATQFYTQINGGNPATARNFDSASITNEGISNKIMSQLGLVQIYSSALKKDSNVLKNTTSVFMAFMSIILFLIAAFVMFSLAFILIARFVILIFLIILAPIGFAGLAVPKLKGIASKWWDALFQQTITAPVLLLLLYIALAVITDSKFLTGFGSTGATPDWSGTVTNNLTGFASVMLSFLVAMGLLLAVVIVAKRISAFGAAGATALAGKLSFGATAFGLRSTAGWGFHGASQAIRRSRIGGTKTGRLLATTFDKGAKGSFDIRGVAMGGGLKGIGVDAGKAVEGGYRARREKAIKGHEEYAKSVGQAFDDRGISKKEEENIAQLETAQEVAETAFKDAKKEYDAAKERLNPEIAVQKAEIARLEAEKARNDKFGVRDASARETERNLEIAQQRLVKTQSDLDVTKIKHDNAATEADRAKKATEEASKEAGGRVAGEKKKAQIAYAENIRGSFPGWVMYGPGGSAAARKIVKEAKKSPDKQLLDTLKKAIAAGEKESNSGEKKGKEIEPEKAPGT